MRDFFKDLNIDTTIKARVTKVERDVYKLSIKQRNKKTVWIDCNTCIFLTYAERKCFTIELECYECGKKENFSGSKAYKKKENSKDLDRKKKRLSNTRKVKESYDESETDMESSC